jgi:hypothetical protein
VPGEHAEMFSMVPYKFNINFVPHQQRRFPRNAQHPKLVRYRNSSVIEQHMVIWTKAQEVGFAIRPIMGRSQRLDVGSLGIWSGWRYQSKAAYLACVIILFLHGAAFGGVANNP